LRDPDTATINEEFERGPDGHTSVEHLEAQLEALVAEQADQAAMEARRRTEVQNAAFEPPCFSRLIW